MACIQIPSTLEDLGWDSFWQQELDKKEYDRDQCGRVVLEHKKYYDILSPTGDHQAVLPGRAHHRSCGRGDLPAVGDWVVLQPNPDQDKTFIRDRLARKSAFSRLVRRQEQVIAANIDYALVMVGLDQEFNPRRIERFLVMAWQSGAQPVLLLNKADLCTSVGQHTRTAKALAPDVPVHVLSLQDHTGVETLDDYWGIGKSGVVLGSSGVGKSTLINTLIGDSVQKTRPVHEGTDQGRHTTTHRQLFCLPRGGILIDTPGIRELQLWIGEHGLSKTFPEISCSAKACYFNDCRHVNEPRCAVKEAVQNGDIDPERFQNFVKLKAEQENLERRHDL